MRFAVRTLSMIGLLLAASTSQADLVAYYNFDGVEVEDSSGFNNNPSSVLFGNFQEDVPTQIGSGTSFNMENPGGGGGGFFVPDSPSLDMAEGLTIAGWVNMSDAANYYFIAVKGPSGEATNNYPGNFELRISPSGFLEYLHQTDPTTGLSFYSSTVSIVPQEWHHVAVVATVGASVEFFVDGVAAGSAGMAGPLLVNDNQLIIGSRADGHSTFLGWMDDLAIWNEPLRNVQIALLADGGGPTDLPEFDPADINSDEEVDLLDYGILRDNFGTGNTLAQGDIDRNGVVNGFDFRLLKNRLGQNGITVPEPSSVLLLSLSAAALLLARRTRKGAIAAAMLGLFGSLSSPANAQLLLKVDPYSGDTTLTNRTGATFELDNYSIVSGSGSLDTVGWDSFTDAPVAGWEKANPRSKQLSEIKNPGSTTLAVNQTISLGKPFLANGYRDLSLEVVPQVGSELAPFVIQYDETPTSGSEIRLPNVSIAEVSSELDTAAFNRNAFLMLTGAGMDYATGTHTIVPDNFMWLSHGNGFDGGVDTAPFVVFDMGAVTDVTDVKIWNYNETLDGRPELLGRGVNLFDISVAADLAGPFTPAGSFNLDVAPGVGDADFSETIALDRDGIRFVRFDVRSNHNGVTYPANGTEPDAAFAGLSEVQFFGIAAASGPLGDTDGDADVDITDLNNVRNNFSGNGLGDTDNDNDVDITDLNNVRNNFGAGQPGAAAVPEPGSLILALCLGVGALATRRRLA
ncbi:MAG: LamG-like jellyroll fold domain-containing protein [Planctomycetia bacterium]|nr:LamG-like jellyroll fold domain-containing protein [Planctomycetia bacterium]